MAAGTHFTSNASSSLRRVDSVSLPRTMSRQMSIYSLTLDEFQSTLGEPKNFGSMNMDELLKNIWTAEESQAMAAALFTDNNNVTTNTSSGNDNNSPDQGPNNPLIQRQNSLTLLPLPQSLSSKTVDDVWKELNQQSFNESLQPKNTYGEITLEDFLIKAGVMDPDIQVQQVPQAAPVQPAVYFPGGNNPATAYGTSGGMPPILGGMTGLISKKEPVEVSDPMLGIGLGPSSSANGFMAAYGNGNPTSVAAQAARNQAEWMESQYKSSSALAQQQQQQLMQLAMMNGGQVNLGGIVKESSPGSPMSDAQGGYMNGNGNYNLDGPLRGRKRILDAPLEKIVERRQRRMIKNRESAARSRARKQAYTVELEAEVTQLKEENMRLRKLQEEENLKRKKQQVLEVISPLARHLPKVLRRTVTGPW